MFKIGQIVGKASRWVKQYTRKMDRHVKQVKG